MPRLVPLLDFGSSGKALYFVSADSAILAAFPAATPQFDEVIRGMQRRAEEP